MVTNTIAPVRPTLRDQLVAARDRLGLALVPGTRLPPDGAVQRITGLQLGAAAAVLAVTMVSPAFADDLLGVTTISGPAILAFKAAGLIGIGWGFFRMMGGRHNVEALLSLGMGALGLAKADTIASTLGLA